MARRKKAADADGVKDFRHADATRKNNPPAGIAPTYEVRERQTTRYAYDPHLDPQLQWAGKAEHTSFEVDVVSLHIHERISSRAILNAVRRPEPVQFDLFGETPLPADQEVQFYQHEVGWANRLILGDSLLVMNSLLVKEGMAGKVQMIYMDPPYGIKYASNFQPRIDRRDVKDTDEDLTHEPEQIKAYRDTWRLGIHSYLTYLRDRLLLCRELLHESGSIFVQINDENLHLVRCLLDEVFGRENFVAVIAFRKTGGLIRKFLPGTFDFLLWYARNKDQAKFNPLYLDKADYAAEQYRHLLLPDGVVRALGNADHPSQLPAGARIFQPTTLESANPLVPFEYCGKSYLQRWKTNPDGLRRLAEANRIFVGETTLRYVRFISDFAVVPLTDIWDDTMGEREMLYAVQTNTKVVERCILMTTDPGDLVFDPTCVRKGTRVWCPSPTLPVHGEGECPSPALPVHGEGECPSPTLPVHGEGECPSPALPACGEGEISPRVRGDARGASPRVRGDERGAPSPRVRGDDRGAPSPRVRGDDRGAPSPRVRGDDRGAPSPRVRGDDRGALIPIEQIQPGDFVLAHDGLPHRVVRTIRRTYRGIMVGIRHSLSDETLWVTADHRILVHRRPHTLGGKADWSGIPKALRGRSKELRKNMTPPERKLWSVLRRNGAGFTFRRQHPIGPYIVDFYCREAAVVVEVDGAAAHGDPVAMEHDQIRDEFLRSLNLRVLRFPAAEVLHNLEGVYTAIQQTCQEQFSPEHAQWLKAEEVRKGDIVFYGPDRTPVRVEEVVKTFSEEEVYDLEVEGAHSFITEVCAVHNCGSGTTAYCAEKWGRRWITCDTSRVALAIARQRLMTAKFDYYELRDPERGPAGGFIYETVPHITLESIAKNTEIDAIAAKYQPQIDKALADLNAALKGKPVRIRVQEGGRAGQVVDFSAPDEATFTMPNGQAVKVNQLLEWEVPREVPHPVWPPEAHEAYWALVALKGKGMLKAKEREQAAVLLQEMYRLTGHLWRTLEEVPDPMPPEDWPEAAQEALRRFWELKRRKRKEIDESIQRNAPQETLYDRPKVVRGVVRVSGPFTVEAIPVPAVEDPTQAPIPQFEETAGADLVSAQPERIADRGGDYLTDMINLLKQQGGVLFPGGKRLELWNIRPLNLGYLHAEAETQQNGKTLRVAVSFGPQHGPVTGRQADEAMRTARRAGFDILVLAGFSIEAAAQALVQEVSVPDLSVHFANIAPDVLVGDLLKTTRASQIFTVFGQPDVRVEKRKDGTYVVELRGVDIYDPLTGEVYSTRGEDVAAWFLDTDYDGKTFHICQAFFPGDPDAWEKLQRALKARIPPEVFERMRGTVSFPFQPGEHKRIAVKVIDFRGNEVVRVVGLSVEAYR